MRESLKDEKEKVTLGFNLEEREKKEETRERRWVREKEW